MATVSVGIRQGNRHEETELYELQGSPCINRYPVYSELMLAFNTPIVVSLLHAIFLELYTKFVQP